MMSPDEKAPGGEPGAEGASGKTDRPTVPHGAPEVKHFFARFDVLPPRHTRQAQTRLAVVAGRPRQYKTAAAKLEESNMLALLMSAKPADFTPFDGPVEMTWHFCSPFRKGERKCRVRAGREIPHTTRPDSSNQVKMCEDIAVAARLIVDDSLVARLIVEKTWGPAAYWSVEIRALDPEGMDEKTAHVPEEGGAAVEPEGNRIHGWPDGQLRFALEGGAE